MTQLIINLSRVTQQVGIIDDKGRKTSFRLMARGRVQTSYEVDPNWIARNPGKVKVVTVSPPVEATATTSTASTAKTAAKKSTTAATTVAPDVESESTSAEGAK
jgi:ABC-type sulfate transport system substrate-binding protein